MFVALLLCWMACKACLGPTTGGGFLLAIFFCRLPLAQAPRPPVAKARDGSLLDRGRVTTQTHAVRQALLTQLEAWLRAQVPTYSLEDLARFHLSALSEWLEEYVVTLYVQGQSRRAAAETLNALAQKFGWLKGAFLVLGTSYGPGTLWNRSSTTLLCLSMYFVPLSVVRWLGTGPGWQ